MVYLSIGTAVDGDGMMLMGNHQTSKSRTTLQDDVVVDIDNLFQRDENQREWTRRSTRSDGSPSLLRHRSGACDMPRDVIASQSRRFGRNQP